MPRYARRTDPGTVQHLISRFVQREYLLDAPGAREAYLQRAQAAFAKTDWSGIAYALMSSHVHWAAHAGDAPSSAFVKPLHVGFAGWFNRTHARLGPVFADRHRSVTCTGATAAALIAYIHNNPVRAGLVDDPAQTRWTSHRMYLGLDPAPPWIDVERGLELCGFPASTAGRRAFHEFVIGRAGDARCAILSGSGMRAARREARAQHRAPVEVAWPLAREAGGERSAEVNVIAPQGVAMRPSARSSTRDVIGSVAEAMGISTELLTTRRRTRTLTRARRLALVIWTHCLGWPTAPMARALGLASSTAAGLIGTARPDVHAQAWSLVRGIEATGH